jgi:hypothetical protein
MNVKHVFAVTVICMVATWVWQVPKGFGQPAVAGNTDEITATVESVDQADRTVLLRGPAGGLLTVHAGPEVKNLAQVKPGDRVVIRYREALAAQIAKPGQPLPPVQESTQQTTAPLGQKPAGTLEHVVQARVQITAVDPEHNRVSFIGPAHVERTAQVLDPDMQRLLRTLKVGDQVDLTYTEAVAIKVEPAGS